MARAATRTPEPHYAWRPGAPPPRPPRPVWPRLTGVALAIAAQGALYLSLRHVATAYFPSWAHHRPAGPLPWPAMVSADIVHDHHTPHRAGLPDAGAELSVPALPAPTLSPAPAVVLPAPDLGAWGKASRSNPSAG